MYNQSNAITCLSCSAKFIIILLSCIYLPSNFSITFEIHVGNDDDIFESAMQICKTNSLLHNTT